jgi:hypothetical protein
MKFKMAATAGLSLTLNPMGKMFQNMLIYVLRWRHLGFPIDIKNINFVENLPMIIPGQFGFNCPSDVSKRFLSETTKTVETKLPRNDHWKFLYKVSVFYADRKSKMAATAIHRLTLDPKTKSCRSRHFEFHIGTKNVKFVEDLPMNIHVQFGFNNICSF